MPFFQTAPELPHPFHADRVLKGYLARVLPPDVHRAIVPEIEAMGDLTGGELYALQQEDRENLPRLVQWDAWGNRVDRVELTPLWKRAQRIAAERGLVATAYERKHGALSRVHQFALVYLFHPSSDIYTCPLAMTDGAAKTLITHQAHALVERALPRLTSRDPARAWTSGQWMTERTGGSDVGTSEAIARQVNGQWRLDGTKWFTSAVTAEMALTLGRPEGSRPGGKGLALFYVETHDAAGRSLIQVNRLKDKLGTRKLPTAELTLDGTPAIPVIGLENGVKAITPMLTITRTWNGICAAGEIARAIALARDYARRRQAFGAALSDKPLHVETFADQVAEAEAAFHLAFRAAELLGREEAREASAAELALLRLVTPLSKLGTARQAMSIVPEVVEVFAGAGYVEDTGIPRLLRDAQVLPIWEGTTNVLSLDALRAIAHGGALEALSAEVKATAQELRSAPLQRVGREAASAVDHAAGWLQERLAKGPAALEAGARGVALTLARAYSASLLCRQAQWSIDRERDGRSQAAAVRFASHGLDRLVDGDPAAAALADDRPMPL